MSYEEQHPTQQALLDQAEDLPCFMFHHKRTMGRHTLYLTAWQARLCDVWQETAQELDRLYAQRPLDWRKVAIWERRRDERFRLFMRFMKQGQLDNKKGERT